MYGKKFRRMLACTGLAVVLAASMLQGCGGGKKTVTQEEALAKMKEFKTGDGSVAIKLEDSWTTEDLGVDFWLGAGSTDGSKAVLVMQFPKGGSVLPVGSMDDVKSLVDESYGVSDAADAEAPTLPGMTGVTASTCKVNADGEAAEAYLIYGETDYAFYSLMYVAEKIKDNDMVSMKASCSSFVETPIEEEDNTTVEITDTVRWFNASYAVLTEINGWDYNRFAGAPANEETKEIQKASLDEWWGVTDRASADENLTWILEEGHRTGFKEDMEYLKEVGIGDVEAEGRKDFILENFEVTDEEAQSYVDSYNMYEQFGADAIAGWDYCRALNLMSFYYLAGYYTEQEALDKSLEIAQTVQPLFTSWDELIASYMRGYEYWAEESSAERQAIYEDLKTRSDNPYTVDYNLTLEKTW